MATRTYENGGFTVFWNSTRCIHTGICLRSLHSVFNLKNRPWVNLDGGDVEQIIATVEKCPTGALRYSSGGKAEPAPEPTAMVPIPDGPLLVRGDLRVVDPETGGVIAEETRVALCRCGKSENQPFCDNSHGRTHFTEATHIEGSARAHARSPADISRLKTSRWSRAAGLSRSAGVSTRPRTTGCQCPAHAPRPPGA